MQALWKSVWRFLRKLDKIFPEDPALPLLGIYPEWILDSSWKKRPTVTVLLGYLEINIRTNGEIQSQKSRPFIICSLLAGGLDITAHKILRIKLVNLKGIKHEKKRNQ